MVVLVILYVVLGRALDPLASLSKGLLDLEDGDYATRLEPPKVKELAVITNRFNTLASVLGVAREENSRLYRQLMTLQEEERREIANELHDEAGACLFGITANASSIRTIAGQLPKTRSHEISRRVGGDLSIADRLKAMNCALLKKLLAGHSGPGHAFRPDRRACRRLPASPSRYASGSQSRHPRQILWRAD